MITFQSRLASPARQPRKSLETFLLTNSLPSIQAYKNSSDNQEAALLPRLFNVNDVVNPYKYPPFRSGLQDLFRQPRGGPTASPVQCGWCRRLPPCIPSRQCDGGIKVEIKIRYHVKSAFAAVGFAINGCNERGELSGSCHRCAFAADGFAVNGCNEEG